ncbi:hypothetical protein A2619_00845 [candidate division WWE3 bacterium RIFOXYD1_FULL_39_9]|uniref:Uncharacterized protein n=1 Tax=candidate division WWE3 bacterium RIFOXYD1_FULL_39_9 TaxID=1802649 RepID=A0A1F4X5K1_UNCKA|nr:MAG: hypothetical protein A2619_00845 [candidate division WWE3 bacterium RIFOXYD1_FULL_39_9]
MICLLLAALFLLFVCILILHSNKSSFSQGIYYPESTTERIARVAIVPLIILVALFALASIVEWQMSSSEDKVHRYVNETYCTEPCSRVVISAPVCITSAETLCQTYEYEFTAVNKIMTVTGVIHASPLGVVLITENVSQKP